MDLKKHFKMYKSGKLWCTAAVVAMLGIAFGTATAHAAENAGGNPVSAVQSVSELGGASQGTSTTAPATQTQSNPAQTTANKMPVDTTTVNNQTAANNGYLDSSSLHDNDGQAQLSVSGWHASGVSNDDPYRYMILYDNTTKQEVARQAVTPEQRDDVQRAFPNVAGSRYAGFNVNFDLPTGLSGHSFSVVDRYSNDPLNGEGTRVDYWLGPIYIDPENRANLDGLIGNSKDDTINVSGWHASNQAIGKKYHYVIAYDQTKGKEIDRTMAQIEARPDVAAVFPGIYNSQKAGFSATFKLSPEYAQDEIVFISRWTDDPAGNGTNYVDYWFNAVTKVNRANLDSLKISNGDIQVAGWHANDASIYQPYHYLIVYDQTANQQVLSQAINNASSADVAAVYGNDTRTAGNSRFNLSLGSFSALQRGHRYALVSRYSDSKDGNGGSGDYVDYWYPSFTFDQQAYYIDSLTTANNQLKVSGWFANDGAAGKQYPYVLMLINGKEVARQQVIMTSRPDVAQVYPQLYNSNNSGFTASFDLPTDVNLRNGNFQFVLRFSDHGYGEGQYADIWTSQYSNKQLFMDRILKNNGNYYYFDSYGNQVHNTTLNIDGIQYTFDANGIGRITNDILPLTTDDAAIQTQRSQIAEQIASALQSRGTVDYDWNNQDDNFASFSMHDTAQLVAMKKVNDLDKAAGKSVLGDQGLAADSATIEKNLANNTLLTGKVQNIFVHTYNVTAFRNSKVYTSQVASDFVQQLNVSNIDGDILGVGSSYDDVTGQFVVAIILFKKGKADLKPEQVTSTVPSATVSNVYNTGVVIPNGLKVGSTVVNSELNGALSQINSAILTGNKGEEIPQSILQLYYDALVGTAGKTGFQGQKIYNNANGDYHYVYWLESNKGDIKNNAWQIFMDNNKGVKYGDAIKVEVSATLTWGHPKSAPVSGVPSSKMDEDQITAAYETGADTGASHEPVKIEEIQNYDDTLIKGVDVSSLIALEDAGVVFYNFNGQPDDLFDILQEAGINYIRVRCWNDPYDASNHTYGGGNNDEANLIKLAKRAKEHGMSVMMTFQYSDFWADPATQIVPKAWQGEDHATMQKSVYNYTKKLLQDLKATGVNVGMVQIGNEITTGILTSQTQGGYWNNPTLAKIGSDYINAGSKAVREVLPDAKIVIQLEGINVDRWRGILNIWKSNNVDYDILGGSAYPFWMWAKKGETVQQVYENTIDMLKNEFGKQFIITETSWPFTDENSDGTNNTISGTGNADFSVDPQGQVDAMRYYYDQMSNAQHGEVLGSFWWEPAWIPAKSGWDNYQYNTDSGNTLGTGWASEASRGYYPDSKLFYTDPKTGQTNSTWGGSSWDNQTLFDDNGHPLESLHMFEGFKKGYVSPNYNEGGNQPTEQAVSKIQLTVTKVYDEAGTVIKPLNPNDVVTESDVQSLVNDQVTALLTGIKGQSISKKSLNALAGELNKELIGTKTYTDASGKKYHYVFWVTGQSVTDKEWQVNNRNKNVAYGSTVTIPVTATLVVGPYDGEQNESQSTQTITSPIQLSVVEAYNDAGTVANPLKINDVVTSSSVQALVNDKVTALLTGKKNQTLPQDSLNGLVKELNTALNGTTVYNDANGKKYHYVFWIAGQSVTDKEWQVNNINTGAKYGSVITIPVTATLTAE